MNESFDVTYFAVDATIIIVLFVSLHIFVGIDGHLEPRHAPRRVSTNIIDDRARRKKYRRPIEISNDYVATPKFILMKWY